MKKAILHQYFRELPAPRTAVTLAARLRAAVASAERVDLNACCDLLGVEVRDAPLHSDSGGHEAILLPLRANRFRVVIDSLFATSLPDGQLASAVHRRRRRFRVAHELGHTFLYDRSGSRPVRLFSGGSQAEENFCDRFAGALLAPPPGAVTRAEDLPAIQDMYDVSLEAAARSLAASATRPRVALWWWRSPTDPRAAILPQWSSDPALGRQLGVLPYRIAARDIEGVLGSALAHFGRRLTATVLPERGQAVAVLNR